MLNSETSFNKHVDALLKLLNPSYELIATKKALTSSGYRSFVYHKERGRQEREVRFHLFLDQYKDGSCKEAQMLIEQRKIVNMLGLMGKDPSEVQAQYKDLNAYMQRYLGNNSFPKRSFIKEDGTKGDGSDLCIMHLRLLGTALWYEVITRESAPDLRHFRLDLVLESYDF